MRPEGIIIELPEQIGDRSVNNQESRTTPSDTRLNPNALCRALGIGDFA